MDANELTFPSRTRLIKHVLEVSYENKSRRISELVGRCMMSAKVMQRGNSLDLFLENENESQ